MSLKDNLMQWRETYAQEKAARVRTESRTEGRADGQRSLLANQLRLKFGPLSAGVQERLAQAEVQQLETWAGRVLTATSLDELWEERD